MNGAKLFACLLFLLAGFFTACSRDGQPGYFVVEVDSLSTPDTISVGADLAVGLWGMVGDDGGRGYRAGP